MEGLAEPMLSANGKPWGILGKVYLTSGVAGINEMVADAGVFHRRGFSCSD